MRDNDVFQVLVTKGNAAMLAAGSRPASLAVGQIGLFDSNTGLSIDGTGRNRDVYLAVGIDTDGDAATDDIIVSAGMSITTRQLKNLTFRPHSAGRPQITDVTGIQPTCGKAYTIRAEFKNDQIAKTQGYVQYAEPYTINTPSCDCGADDCAAYDGNLLVQSLKAEINLKNSKFLTASIITPIALTIATHGVAADLAIGAEVSDADMEDVIAYFSTVNSDTNKTNDVVMTLRLTTKPLAVKSYQGINLQHYYPRQTTALIGLKNGFENSGAVATTTQLAAFEEGSYYDIKQKEYKAGGYRNDGPYRVSGNFGLAFETPFTYFTETGGTYDQFVLDYISSSIAGTRIYDNFLNTVVVVPEADTVTRNSIAAVFDALFAELGFDTLASDVAAASVTPTVVEPTSAKGQANDGLA